MNTSINLALDKKTTSEKKSRFTVYIYIIFVVVIAVAMGAMLINIILKSEYSTLEATEQQLQTQINNQADKKLKMLIIAERYNNIKSLYASRGQFDIRFSDLVNQFPNSVNIVGLELKDEEFILSLRSSDLMVMNNILENQLPEYLEKNEIGIRLADINSFKALEGMYTADLRFEFAGGLNNE